MTRTGKIARLPQGIREALNRRMADGEPGVDLMRWLNGLPEVRQVLQEHFGGRAIKEQNVSEWKQGGFMDWQAQQETLACAWDRVDEAKELEAATDGAMAKHLGTVLLARYAQLLSGWNGEVDEAFWTKLRGLQMLSRNITLMRREDARSERLQLEKDKRSQDEKAVQAKALKLCLEEDGNIPEVAATFAKAWLDDYDEKAGATGRVGRENEAGSRCWGEESR